MKLKVIFATALGYILGVLTLIPILLLILIQSLLGNTRLFNPLLKFACRSILLFFGIRVSCAGRTAVDRTEPHIFIANHVNLFDLFILYGYLPGYARGVELDEHFSWPVWGTLTRRLGTIPISHTDTKKAISSLAAAAKAFSQGTSIIILPEGRRTRDGNLQMFKRGPFRLAKHTGADIIPVAMKGAWERKTVHSFVVTPGRVELKFGARIEAEEVAQSSERQLRELAKARVQELLSN